MHKSEKKNYASLILLKNQSKLKRDKTLSQRSLTSPGKWHQEMPICSNKSDTAKHRSLINQLKSKQYIHDPTNKSTDNGDPIVNTSNNPTKKKGRKKEKKTNKQIGEADPKTKHRKKSYQQPRWRERELVLWPLDLRSEELMKTKRAFWVFG